MAVAGLILGILSLVGGSIPVTAAFPMWLFGLIGIILSSIARKKAKIAGQPSGMATAGLVLSIIGFILSLVTFIACLACAGAAAGALSGW